MSRVKKSIATAKKVAIAAELKRIKWTISMIENLIAWFAEIDVKTKTFKNVDYYIKKVKIESAKRAHVAFNFEELHPNVNSQKVCDKFDTMMFIYKIVRNLANSID